MRSSPTVRALYDDQTIRVYPAYSHEIAWIEGVEDVTPLAQKVEAAVKQDRLDNASSLLPVERPCPLSTATREPIEADPETLR